MLAWALVLGIQFAIRPADTLILSSGDIEARREVVMRILATPPSKRPQAVWQTLRQEVDRLVACLDVDPPPAQAGKDLHCEVRPGSEDDYLPNLIEALSQSRDPAMIPTLIKVTPSGGIARAALARFGDLAVPALIESSLSSRSGPWVTEAGGSMLTLAEMLQGPALGDGSRITITATAASLLQTLVSAHWLPIVILALSTQNADLRSEVEKLATDPLSGSGGASSIQHRSHKGRVASAFSSPANQSLSTSPRRPPALSLQPLALSP